jgi:hypothetical protein
VPDAPRRRVCFRNVGHQIHNDGAPRCRGLGISSVTSDNLKRTKSVIRLNVKIMMMMMMIIIIIQLTLNLLTATIVAPPSNASKWQVGFNSVFKGLS